jgi:hypothetical protein
LEDCGLGMPPPLVTGSGGKDIQDRVWGELVKKLEGIKPGGTGRLKMKVPI